jgi:twitching motility protein PilT
VALAAAETGHLVFSTLHTSSAAETLDRIINLFPPQDRDMLQLRLSGTLKGVISQKLIPRADGTGRIGAVEVMVATPTVAKLIEEGRASQIYGAIAEGNFWGMQTMNQCLLKYYRAGLISEEEALHNAGNVTEMKQMIRRPS